MLYCSRLYFSSSSSIQKEAVQAETDEEFFEALKVGDSRLLKLSRNLFVEK